MKKWHLAVSILMVVLVGGMISPVWATETDPNDPAVTLDTVVVTASREPETLASVPANVTVISADQITNSTAQSVPEALAQLAGIHISDVTGNGRNFSVDLRAFGESAPANVLVTVDGRRINQADLSGVDWALIPLNRIARIEVVRSGRGAVLYGDNAAGGVINIITKEGEAFAAEGTLRYGSYDTFGAEAALSGTARDLTYALSASYRDTDGYRDNSQSELSNAGLSLGFEPGERFRLTASGGYHDDNTGLPGALKQSDFEAGADRTDSLNPEDFADTQDGYAKGGAEIFFLSDSAFKIDLGFRNRQFSSYSTFAGGDFQGDTDIDTITVSPQVTMGEKIGKFANRLILGVDYTNSVEDIVNTSLFFGETTTGQFELEKTNIAYFIHDEFEPVEKLTVSAGYRRDEADFDFSSGATAKTSQDVDAFTAGLNYLLAPQSNVYFSYSRSFRYPLLDELFNFFTNTIDAGLVPQTSDDYEVGLRYRFDSGLALETALFQIDTQDEIFYNPNNFANENLDGDTRRQGVALSLDQTLGRLTIGAAYTYTKAEISGGAFDGNTVPNVAENVASANVGYNFDFGFSVMLIAQYVGERWFISDFGNAFGQQEDYLLLNAKLAYQWQRLKFFVDLNNITDEAYSAYGVLGGFPTERAYYPSPKFNATAGVSIAL